MTSRHSQIICMSCFDNEVDVSTYVKRLSKRMQESGHASSCSKNIHPAELQCRTLPSHKKNSEMEVLFYSHTGFMVHRGVQCFPAFQVTVFEVNLVCCIKNNAKDPLRSTIRCICKNLIWNCISNHLNHSLNQIWKIKSNFMCFLLSRLNAWVNLAFHCWLYSVCVCDE